MDTLSVEEFLRQYLTIDEEGPPVFFPKSEDPAVVFDAWRVIGENFNLNQPESFYRELTQRWMEPGRIRWCPRETYQPAIAALQKGNAYESLRHFRRLANNGRYMEFPVFFEVKDVPAIWKRIIEYTTFQIPQEPEFYQRMAQYWLSYCDRAVRLLVNCVQDQNVDRFANHIHFMSKYGFDMRRVYRLVLDNISFAELDNWETLLSLRAKRLRLDDNFDVFSQVILHLLSEFDAVKNVKQSIIDGDEVEFLEEYSYLSEAGFQMKFPLYISHVEKIKAVWEEAILKINPNADKKFIYRVTQLWIELMKPIALQHEHWEDSIVFEVIEGLEKRTKHENA